MLLPHKQVYKTVFGYSYLEVSNYKIFPPVDKYNKEKISLDTRIINSSTHSVRLLWTSDQPDAETRT